MINIKKVLIALAAVATLASADAQNRQQRQQQQNPEEAQKRQKEMIERRNMEEKEYYANADTALYGVRYRMKYLFDKEQNLRFEEDRVTLVGPKSTLYMSYEGIGERRWRNAHPGEQGGDAGLAYRLTPSFYFFYPAENRLVETYRILADDVLVGEEKPDNKWNITNEKKKIGEYECQRATINKGGRSWNAWFTTELPGKAAPRNLTGLPGVVLEVSDADGEVQWKFNGIVKSEPNDALMIKFPDSFTPVPKEHVRKVIRLYAANEGNSYFEQAGVLEKNKNFFPERLRPSTGLDACRITNPIER